MSRRSPLWCPLPGDSGAGPRTNATGRQHGKTGLVRLVVDRTDVHGVWVREEDGLEYHVSFEEWKAWARWPRIAWTEIDPKSWSSSLEASTESPPAEQLGLEFSR